MARTGLSGACFVGIATRKLAVRQPRFLAGRARRRATLIDRAPYQKGATVLRLSSTVHHPPAPPGAASPSRVRLALSLMPRAAHGPA